MPSHLVSRLDLDKLYPPFLERVLETLAACEKRGAVYVANTGFRSNAEQAKLYFQGRTSPGKIVTDARPGLSCHNYGIAVDVVRDGSDAPGLQPDWRATQYGELADQGDRAGLQVNVPGGWDFGHIQLPVHRKANRSEKEAMEMLKRAGSVKGAWAILDVFGPW